MGSISCVHTVRAHAVDSGNKWTDIYSQDSVYFSTSKKDHSLIYTVAHAYNSSVMGRPAWSGFGNHIHMKNEFTCLSFAFSQAQALMPDNIILATCLSLIENMWWGCFCLVWFCGCQGKLHRCPPCRPSVLHAQILPKSFQTRYTFFRRQQLVIHNLTERGTISPRIFKFINLHSEIQRHTFFDDKSTLDAISRVVHICKKGWWVRHI
jgi:hypothetical protein